MQLTIIRGLPGSGKTTIAKNIMAIARTPIEHYEADMYFEDEYGNYNYDKSQIRQAHEWCQAQVEDAMKRGVDIVVSNTFVKKWEMKKYLELAKQYSYDTKIIVATGEYGNIHGVPDNVIDRMKGNFEV